MPKTTYLANALLDHVLRNTPYTSPATVYLGFFTVAPTIAGGGTECTGTNYARTAVSMDAAASGESANGTTAVSCPTPGAGGWGTGVAWGIFDAASGGNLLYFDNLYPNQSFDAGVPVSVPIGAIAVREL